MPVCELVPTWELVLVWMLMWLVLVPVWVLV
jgi:hypothetical protein